MGKLELLLCPDRWQGCDAALRRAVDDTSSRQILIVPEQDSFRMECGLLRAGGDTISRHAEVLSFSRLANRVFSVYGGVAELQLDKGGRLLLMQKTLESVRSRLKCFGSADGRPEQMLRLLDVLDECSGAQVTPEKLRDAADSLSGPLAAKLEDLSLIFAAYAANAAQQDPTMRLERLREKLETTPFAADYAFTVAQFIDFTGQELSVLGQLMLRGRRVTVCLACDALDGEEPVMEPSRRSARTLAALAQRLGVQVELRRIAPGERAPELHHLRCHLFGVEAAPWAQPTDRIQLLFADTTRWECLCAARRIRALAASGVRYRDMALACCDPSSLPMLRHILRQYDIPICESGADPILEKPILSLLLSALRAATGGMQRDDVFGYLKSSLSPLPRRQVDELENYAILWNIRGALWRRPFVRSPGGMDSRQSASQDEALARLNEAREAGLAPLWALSDALYAAATTGEQVRALFDFLQKIDIQTRLQTLTDAQIAAGQLEQAQETAQLYETVISALEQLYGILGETERRPERFTDLLAALLGQYQVSAIPATLDCVWVGQPTAMRQRCAHLIVIGGSEGQLPQGYSDYGILTEQDRSALRALSLPLTAGSDNVLEREQEALYHAFSGVTESVFCAGSAAAPSYLLTRLSMLFPQCRTFPAAPPPFDGALASELAVEAFSLPQTVQDALPAQVRAMAQQGSAAAAYRFGALAPETVQALYGDRFYLSASQIDKYFSCRFQYFLRYGLKAKERGQAAFDAPAFGTFVHAVLEHTAKRVLGEGGFQTVTPARVEEIAQEEIARYTKEALHDLEGQEERFVYLYRRNEQEVLHVAREMAEELAVSSFVPQAFELEFGGSGALPAIQIRGKTMEASVNGLVDRVDAYAEDGRTYLRIVDYKTGKKTFDYTDIREGVGLQMLLYLFALEQARGDTGAGVLYFHASDPILTAASDKGEKLAKKREEQRRHSGLLLDDPHILAAMEHYADKPKYLPYDPNGRSRGSLASLEQFAMLERYVGRCLRRMVDGLSEGQVAPDPYLRGREHNVCTWCDYRDACHLDTYSSARVRKSMKADEFWSRLEAEDHG